MTVEISPKAERALPRWSHSRNWGYAPTGGVGLILLMASFFCFSAGFEFMRKPIKTKNQVRWRGVLTSLDEIEVSGSCSDSGRRSGKVPPDTLKPMKSFGRH